MIGCLPLVGEDEEDGRWKKTAFQDMQNHDKEHLTP